MRSLRLPAELPAGSMADIAFLLLTFFLVTTVIPDRKGLTLTLPQWNPLPIEMPLHKRNLYEIQINASDGLLIRGEPGENFDGIKEELIRFILNPENSPSLSESPLKAVISIKTDRATSYSRFIQAVDVAQSAYFEIYANRAGLTVEALRALNLNNPTEKDIYDQARNNIPMNISIAHPVDAKK